MSTPEPCIRIQLPAEKSWVCLMQTAAEQAGSVFGLDCGKKMRLVHCAEELLLFLSSADAGDIEVVIQQICTGVEIGISFASSGVDLSALNLVSSPDVSGEDIDLSSLPLLLASRMSDGFRVGLEGRRMEIVMRVDKDYPKLEPFPVERFSVQGRPVLSEANDADALLEACNSVVAFYPDHVVPLWCHIPVRLTDMVCSGQLSVIEARDAVGRLCGVLFWESRSKQIVTFYGPYDFSSDGSVAGELVDSMLQSVARTSAKNVFSSLVTQPLSDYGFELLARLPYHLESTHEPVVHPVWGRMLQEDFGGAVWTHSSFDEYLRGRYIALEIVRDLRPVSQLGEVANSASVIGARLNPVLSEAFLKPELNGDDIGINIERHVLSLTSAGYKNIFFEIDLAKGWHAALGEHLSKSHFHPELLLPHGGQSDTLIFRYDPES